MLSERAIWIALPAHFNDQGNLRIAAFVSLRLALDQTGDDSALLNSFSPAVQNWATHVNSQTFTVEFENGPAISGLKPVNQADGSLWSALFPPDTPVGSWKFTDHSIKPLHSFSVEDVLALVRKLYGTTASSGAEDPPFIDDPHGPLAALWPLRHIVNKTRTISSYKNEPLGELESGLVTNSEYDENPDEQALGNAHRFYLRPWYREQQPPEDAASPEPIEIYAPEFHERLSLLGDFPELLRRLGLVVVLDLPIDGGGLPAEGTVRVQPDGETDAPGTAYELKADNMYFYVRPSLVDPDLAWMRDGWLLCDHERIAPYQVDVDGAALKTVEFASLVGHITAADLRGPATAMQAALPSLRSAGWTLAQRDRATAVHAKFIEAKKHDDNLEAASSMITLHAEQLIRGWRVDVLDEGRWLSLHERNVTHTFPASGPGPVSYRDEGFAKGTTATSNPQKTEAGLPASEDLYIHEAVFGWSGWSLSVPRPGKHLPTDGSAGTDNVEEYDDSKHADYGMTTATEVAPGTLPRLRFGRTYAFRARAVDLAGNSHPFDPGLQVDDDVRTMDRMYRRFEPVQTPLLVRREEYTEGESLTHLVIRSNGVPGSAEEVNAGAYADGLNESTGKTIYRAHSDRHVLPPKTSQDIAEAHGGFDALLDAVAPAATATLYNDIVARDAALVPDVDGNSVIDLLHLADPYAVGVHFTAFDGKGALLGKELDHRFDVSSPPAGTFRLEVVEGTMFSMVTVDPRLVRITVPRGERIRIELSSLFTRDESPAESAKLQTFAIWDWCDTKTAELQTAALRGRHWMLTPRRLLQLTHAVQQPFATHPDLPGNPTVPDSRGLKAHRQAGETFVTLTGPIAVHARTTGRLEVLARWREAIDDPADPSPRYEDRHTSACAFDISPDEDNALVTNADLSILSDPDIAEYKRCVRCQSLVAKIGKHSPCPASPQKASLQPEPDKSSGHLLIDNAVYALRPVQAQASTPAWRTCLACSCLFSDTGSAWPCSASENHVPPPLSSISLVPAAPTTTGDGGWHRCKNCGVAFNVGAKPWACPGAGPHEPDGPPFVLPRIDRVSKHEFGDTKHRMVVYHSVATTRFREFFPEEIQTDLKNLQQEEPHEGRDEPALTHIVPSCARPAAPDVEYIVPTFRWEDHSTAGVMARTRIGRGVRIYLRRPWFSSGDGELLGVLLRQPVGRLSLPMPDDRPVVDALASYVTDFGRDPLWEGASPPASPLVKEFPLAFTDRPTDVFPLAEVSASVLVAPHQVYWDEESGVWYADVDIETGEAYFPMVRLALARFQPHSLNGLHLSRVVQTDFIQPLPDRHASVSLTRGGATLSFSGLVGRVLIGIPRNPAQREPPSVAVELQKRDPSMGDFGWSTVQEVQLNGRDFGARREWSGSISLAPGVVGSQQYRLLFVERELYPRDTGDGVVHVTHFTPTTSRITCAMDFPI